MTTLYESAPDDDRLAIEEALRNCAREAIHLIGKIQPFGILLAADVATLTVRAASDNARLLFPRAAERPLGQPLSDLLGDVETERLQALSAGGHFPGAAIWSVAIERDGRSQRHDAQVYAAGGLLILEVEIEPHGPGDVFHDLFVPIRDALWKLDAESDLGRYAKSVVDQVRLLTDFDRVMMYRFDSNWDGEVIAESKVESAGSYLGNHFPASDIPAQARQLYTRNLVRLIGDVDALPVPIRQSGTGDAPVDLTHSWLRSLSPVHVEYLRNMGVRASLSISLVQNDRLWGLIACHHFSPKYVSMRERELDELIGRTVSLKLMNMEFVERSELANRMRNLLYELTDLIRRSEDIDSIIHVMQDKLLGLVRSRGVIVSLGGRRHEAGEVPAEPLLDAILSALRRMAPAPVYSTRRLGDLIDPELGSAAGPDFDAGMMVAPLDHRLDNYVMWFRPGLLRTLRWAGKPDKEVIREADGVRISPRKSFETWIDIHRSESLAWSQAEIDAANSLSLALIETLSERALKTSEEHYRLLAENSTDMIASLDLNGRFRFVSPACRELLGLDSAGVIGLYLGDLLSDQPNQVQQLLYDLQPLGSTETSMLGSRRLDGSQCWIEATLKHTLGSHGDSEIIMNARDVTQRYNYQLAIEEMHRRNSRILDAAGEGLISLDQDGRVSYANELAQRVLGLDERHIVGLHCCDAVCGGKGRHTCEQDADQCPFLATLRDGETRQGHHTLHNAREQRPVPVNYVCTPLSENGAIVGSVLVFNETTHAVAGDADRATEVILDQALEAVMVTSPDGRITSVNRAFSEITGYTADEAMGKTPRLLKSGVHTPHFYEEFWHQLREQGRWTGEIWNRRKNGEVYPQWASVSVIRDGTGTIRNYVCVFSDISKAKKAEEKLYYLATHDTLTELPNRVRFTEQLAKVLDRHKRSGASVAVAFIDLDNFKIINDTLGHAVGDVYLKAVAARLQASTRKQDILARWGGDEFILAIEDVSDRASIGESIRRVMSRLSRPIHLSGHELIPTASIGVALFPDDGQLPVDLIKAADSAMYLAKKQGRNRFDFYDESMGATLDMKLTLSGEMRRALAEGQFFLVYQPQVDPAGGTVKGVEALIRWAHPARGMVAPADFLPMADELGLLEEIGNWVLAEACRQMRQWLDAGVAIPRVAVNVAPCQLKEHFAGSVAAALTDSGIAPACLEIEITEGALESGEQAIRITSDLRALGVLLSVDDFGTGYSSLAHLRAFPITCFKIDKSFIDGLPGNQDDVAIVRTILALGTSFKVEVVAEGVETAEQAAFLHAAGVTSIQGYYYSRPLAPADLLRWLAERPLRPG